MTPKVSIIIPVYNAEGNICRCLDSLLKQSLSNIEIIAVNDGSKDRSLNLLNQYMNKDERIVVIDQENSGVSSARNTGISVSRGEYIGFVDSDDWVDIDMYEELYNLAVDNQADMVMCSYIREFGNHSKEKIFNLPEKVHYCQEEVHLKLLRRLIGPINEEIANPEFLDAWGTVWSKIYRKEIIKKNGIGFTDLKEIGTNEDLLFNIYASYYSNSFIFINRPFYHYWRNNDTSFTSGYNPNLINQWFSLYSRIECFLNDKRMEQDYFRALNNRICLGVLGLGLNTISKMNTVSGSKKIMHLNGILSDERIRNSFKQFDLSFFSLHWKIFYFCAKYRCIKGFYVILVVINYLRRTLR